MASWSAVQPQDAGAGDWAPRGFAGLKDCNPALLRTTGMLQSQAIEFDPAQLPGSGQSRSCRREHATG
jgi:hypothetical protein